MICMEDKAVCEEIRPLPGRGGAMQSVMGHKDIQTTMDIYAEATEEKKQESFERLALKMDVF